MRVRVGAAQQRREECAAYEDPRARVRAGEGQVGAGRCCARARQAETVAERLRREGARVHEDTRFDVGAARPLANLRRNIGQVVAELKVVTPNKLCEPIL